MAKKQEVNLFTDMTNKEAQEIAVAIVRQAVDDYRHALHTLYRKPNKNELKRIETRINACYEATNTINECEDFFRSKWYQKLCSIAGENILEKVQSDILEEANVISLGMERAKKFYKDAMEIGIDKIMELYKEESKKKDKEII